MPRRGRKKKDKVKDLIHRHLPSPTLCICVSRITEIGTNKNNKGNGSSVISICQTRQKYFRDLREKKREGFDPQTSSPTLCIYVSRITEISTNKRKFSNIDLPERAKVLPRLKEKNVKDLIHRHQALLFVPAYHE